MVIVEVWYQAAKIRRETLMELHGILPSIIARALHSGDDLDAHLRAYNVKVRFQSFGDLDVHAYPLEISVEALCFAERMEHLLDTMSHVALQIAQIIGKGIPFDIFPRLPQGTYVAHTGR